MRTKTILLSGVVAALTSASLMAQVYSLNAVGYINVTCTPGFSIMANQLNTTNNNLSPLLDAQLLDGGKDGTTIFKFSGGAYTTLNIDSFSTVVPFIPWDQTTATSTTLNPGEAVFFYNPYSTNITFTFVGTVLQGSLTNTLGLGFSLASSLVPQQGALDLALLMPEVDGDNVFIFNTTSHAYDLYTGDQFSTSGQPWDAPGGRPASPTVAVGQGFFYQNTHAVAVSWVRSFNVN